MSEFKFACPVCGQHITADASASGTQLECPTCFQKIVVPQAPESGNSKFILSASQVSKPRPTAAFESNGLAPIKRSTASKLSLAGIALLVLAVAAGAAVLIYKKQIFPPKVEHVKPQTNSPTKTEAEAAPRARRPVPPNITWSSDLAKAAIPDATATGGLHGEGFVCELAVLRGATLSLRQGKEWPPDPGLSIVLKGLQGEELSGKTVEVMPDRPLPAPLLIMWWRNQQEKAEKQEFKSGYTMKLVFGQAANRRIPGRIYVCLPDEAKSCIAGTFVAEIRKPQLPKKPKAPPAK